MINGEQVDIVEWIPTIVTAIATVAVAVATIYYAYTLRESTRKIIQRPRKTDETNHIIKHLIDQCKGEIKQLDGKHYWTFTENLFAEHFLKNSYRIIIFNDFLNEHVFLGKAIKNHDEIVYKLDNTYKNFKKAIKTGEFRQVVEKSHEEFNQNNPKLKFGQEVESLSKSIIMNIIREIDISNNSLGESFKSFWKQYGKKFLDMRNQEELKGYFNNMKTLANQLRKIDTSILKLAETILNDYTKEYGISLGEELKSPW